MSAGAAREVRDPGAALDALLAFLIYMLAPVVAAPFFGPAEDLTQSVENDSARMLAGIAAVVAFAVWRRAALAWRLRPAQLGLYALFLILWVPFAMVLYPIALRSFGVEFVAQEPLRYHAVDGPRPGYWLVLLCTCAGAPVAEELVFRGFLYRAIEQTASGWVAVLVTAVLFGLLHGPTFAFPVGLLGLFFGYLRLRTGGVGTPILAHMVHNAWTVGVVTLRPDLVEVVYGK